MRLCKAHRPANQAAGPLGRGSAEPVRHAGGRGGAAHQGGAGRRRGRARLARAGGRARLAAQGAGDGRRPRGARDRRRAAGSDLVATSSRSRRRSSARARTWSSSASSRATPTAPCSGPPSRTGCGARVSQVAELTVGDGKVRGKRQTEFGYDVIEAPLPAVVAVSDAINEPRYPSLKGIMGAKKKPQETLGAADLGVDAGAARRSGIAHDGARARRPAAARRRPQDRGRRQRREQIVDFLAEKKLL